MEGLLVRFRVVSDIVDIVSAFRIVSTQSDQAHIRPRLSTVARGANVV
jgi:hypothetical protein